MKMLKKKTLKIYIKKKYLQNIFNKHKKLFIFQYESRKDIKLEF